MRKETQGFYRVFAKLLAPAKRIGVIFGAEPSTDQIVDATILDCNWLGQSGGGVDAFSFPSPAPSDIFSPHVYSTGANCPSPRPCTVANYKMAALNENVHCLKRH